MFKIYGAGGLGVDIEPELIAIANKSMYRDMVLVT